MTKRSYRQLRAELDEVVAKIQNESVDIDEATKLYEQGLKLINDLQKHLADSKNQIKKLQKTFETNLK